MTEEALEARVSAIERTLTDGHELADLPDGAELAARVDALETRADEIESRLDELEAATLAVRGYVGNIRSVNRDVERRADAALAAVERLTPDDAPLRAPNGEPVAATEEYRAGRNGHPGSVDPNDPNAQTAPNARGHRATGAETAETAGGADERESSDSPIPEGILSRVRGSL